MGLVVALILGWWALPGLMMAEKKQPIAFNHALHTQDLGMDCSACHYLRADGTFTGTPDTATCAECHYTTLGDNPEEARFVREYVETGREIKPEWLVYQKQPDNVFFSHAAHSLERCGQCHEYEKPADLCSLCHLDMGSMTTPPVYTENRLSGYTKGTMIMWQCERCHADPGHTGGATRADNSCFVCHK